MYTVQYSPSAIRDLNRIRSEVFDISKSSEITTRYLNGLLDKADAYSKYPKTGIPLYYENLFSGYYYVAYKAYLIFYRLKDQNFYVERILYGKCDYLRHLHIIPDGET